MEKLLSINSEKVKRIESTKVCHEKKRVLLEGISSEMFGKSVKIDMAFILQMMRNDKRRSMIEEILDEMESLASETREIGRENQRLIDHALRTIDGTVRSVTGVVKKVTGYGKEGREKMGVRRGAILAGRV